MEALYRCDMCKVSFSKEGNLKRHNKRKHSELSNSKEDEGSGITAADVEWCMADGSNSDVEDPGPLLWDCGGDYIDYSDEEQDSGNAHNGQDPFDEEGDVSENAVDSTSYLHSEEWERVYKSNRGVNAFPFPNRVSYRFHLWRCLRGHMISDASLDALLSIFSEEIPGFEKHKEDMLFRCKTVHSFLRKMDKRMPIPPTFPVKVTQDKTVYDMSSSKRKLKLSTTVSCFKVGSTLEHVFSTRHLRKHLQFGCEDVGVEPVYEFNQTPFVRDAFKYQQLISFYTDTEEILVGDFVHLEQSNHLLQIESLFYKQLTMSAEGCGRNTKEAELMPPLYLRGIVCDITSTRNRPFTLLVRRDRNAVDIPASRVLRKVKLEAANVDLPSWEVRNSDKTTSPYIHQPRALTPRAVRKGEPFVWLNFYVDKFESAGKNAKSTEAVYMEIANVDSRFSGGQEFVFTITLLPAGCAFAEAWEPVRLELASLVKRGVLLFDCVDNVNRTVGVGVAGLIGDHMQQVVSTRTFGPQGTLNSRACVARKDENHLVTTGTKASCAHFTTARRQAQTNVVVLQIADALDARAEARVNKQRTQVTFFMCV